MDSFPELLSQLVSLAYPAAASEEIQAPAGVPEEQRSLQMAAVRSLAALGVHDGRARSVYLSRLLPAALGAAQSQELCWQAVIAGCPAVFAAGQSMGGEQCKRIILCDIVQSVVERECMTRATTAEGAVLNARRLCKLTQLQVSAYT